ncbi:MAG: uroporphyrinogen-III synthase [Chitinophagales bacterium]
MPDHPIEVLCTRPLSLEVLNRASRQGFQMDTFSFIEIEYAVNENDRRTIDEIRNRSAFVAFTSKHAVEAIRREIDKKIPNWKIFCLSASTLDTVEFVFGKKSILTFADSAEKLADLIIQRDIPELTFFCGNQRRDDLLVKLSNHQILVREIIVYLTQPVPKKVDRKYQAILFFSPSAVKSFFSVNPSNQETIYFAIGQTTAYAIRKFSKNKIVVADFPSEESLVNMMIKFFKEEQFVKKIR